ncbi:MAG: signal recognition particle-docking protein FtsY, partial [Deltaproteobacteria bacterium]|nr:signal recognition particle-docking protein FtsY [Deltaproteobacteria bacterium]
TAKGGVLVCVAEEVGIPVLFIGIGENMDDLKEFSPNEFVEALFED